MLARYLSRMSPSALTTLRAFRTGLCNEVRPRGVALSRATATVVTVQRRAQLEWCASTTTQVHQCEAVLHHTK